MWCEEEIALGFFFFFRMNQNICKMALFALRSAVRHDDAAETLCVCVVKPPGGHTAVRRGSLARVVAEGLPDHTGGGGGRQEHQQTGGQGDAHRLRHPQGLVSLLANLPASCFSAFGDVWHLPVGLEQI